MADASAKIDLDASGFVSGAEKASRAAKRVADDSAESARRVGGSMQNMERDGSRSSERVAGGIRGISHALRATTGEAGALRFGLIEIARAAGLGTASIIGLGVAAEGIERVARASYEAAQAMKVARAERELFVSGPNVGKDVYSEQLGKLKANSDKISSSRSGFIGRLRDELGGGAYAANTPDGEDDIPEAIPDRHGRVPKTNTQKEDNELRSNQQEARRISGLIAENARRVNDLEEEGVRIGEKAVKVAQLRLQADQARTAIIYDAKEKGTTPNH